MAKITVDTKSLVDSINWVTRSFDGKDDKAFVALVVDSEGKGFLSHTNPTSYMKSDLQVHSSDLEAGDDLNLALEGRFIQRLAGALDVTGSTEFIHKDDTLTLRSKAGKFTVPLLNARIPSVPEVEVVGEVDDAEFFDSLQRLAKLTDPASAALHPFLGTVDVKPDPEGKKLVMMATDRYTLGEITMSFAPHSDGEDFFDKYSNIMIPSEAAVIVAPSKGLTATVDLVFSEASGDKFGYRFADGRVALFSLKVAEPLTYASLKEGTGNMMKHEVVVGTKDLQKALGVISNLAWDEPVVFMELTSDTFTVHDTKGTNRLEVEAEGIVLAEGEEKLTVKFIRSVINSAFSPVATASLKLKFGGGAAPCLLEPVLDTGEVSDQVFILAKPSA